MQRVLFACATACLLAACSGDGSSTGGGGGQGSTTGASTSATGATTSATSTSATTTGASTSSASSGTGGTGAFSLTSTGFAEGQAIAPKYACAAANLSPDLAWTGVPAGTQSFAVILTDQSNSLLHWVIWDIPSNATGLPEGVEKVAQPSMPAGAKQAKSYDGATYGYLGPCPPSTHTYQFVVHALDVATLPGVTVASTRAEVATVVAAHDLGTAALSGTYTP